jgi:hypothetical protein
LKYIIEDTEDGFQLSIARSLSGDNKKMKGSRVTFREPGGHGRLEQLYGFAERTYTTERAERLGKLEKS